MRDLTRVGYENYFTVYSQDYRLYLVENQLRLTKKYLRFVLDEMSTMQKSIYELSQNQKLLAWALINQAGNQTAPNPSASSAGDQATITPEASIPSGGGRL